MDALHGQNLTELDVHALFGTQYAQVVQDWYESHGNRTLIFQKSGFAGSGKFGTKFIGDNKAEASDMGMSVTGVMA